MVLYMFCVYYDSVYCIAQYNVTIDSNITYSY